KAFKIVGSSVVAVVSERRIGQGIVRIAIHISFTGGWELQELVEISHCLAIFPHLIHRLRLPIRSECVNLLIISMRFRTHEHRNSILKRTLVVELKSSIIGYLLIGLVGFPPSFTYTLPNIDCCPIIFCTQ